MISAATDGMYLQKALELAKIRRGFCAPNPAVGAVLVQDGKIIGTGYHYAAGFPHAEVDALQGITEPLSAATLYVTLEPCSHVGKTPPCTNLLINKGIHRVVYAYQDPNPIVAGRGEQTLRQAGIQCVHLPLPEIDVFYASYAHWHRTHTPFLTAKIAMSLDHKIAGKNGEPLEISGKELAHYTHLRRKESDAILTTVKTIIADDPQLNARLNHEIIAKPLYILDSALTLPLTARVFTTAESITLFHAKKAPLPRKMALEAQGVRCIAVESNAEGLDLQTIIELIGKDDVHALWIEVGARCFSALVKQNLLQQALLYIAPYSIGEGVAAFTSALDFRGCDIRWEQAGKDVLCEIHW